MMGRCESCVYWHKTNLFRQGQCRRHAPLYQASKDHRESNAERIWPLTVEDDSCGDYELGRRPDSDGGVYER